jgi:CRP-like cAMP-binding protein
MSEHPPTELELKKQILYGVALFTGISEKAFEFLASQATESRLSALCIIVRQGDPGTKLFIIAKGEVRVVRQGRQREIEVARMRDGDFFGEMCILERLPRSATVQAMTDTRLLLLSYAAFEVLFEQMPLEHHRVLTNMARALSARLRDLGDFFALRA